MLVAARLRLPRVHLPVSAQALKGRHHDATARMLTTCRNPSPAITCLMRQDVEFDERFVWE